MNTKGTLCASCRRLRPFPATCECERNEKFCDRLNFDHAKKCPKLPTMNVRLLNILSIGRSPRRMRVSSVTKQKGSREARRPFSKNCVFCFWRKQKKRSREVRTHIAFLKWNAKARRFFSLDGRKISKQKTSRNAEENVNWIRDSFLAFAFPFLKLPFRHTSHSRPLRYIAMVELVYIQRSSFILSILLRFADTSETMIISQSILGFILIQNDSSLSRCHLSYENDWVEYSEMASWKRLNNANVWIKCKQCERPKAGTRLLMLCTNLLEQQQVFQHSQHVFHAILSLEIKVIHIRWAIKSTSIHLWQLNGV